MIVKCPVCEAECDRTPGKYQCDCGAKFYVDADGNTSTSKPSAQNGTSAKTVRADVDRAIPPRTTHDDTAKAADAFDPDRTVVNMRVRRERGELQVGDVVLGRYELLEKLGSGVMGVVFKCRDRISQVEYAVKMVPPELARDADAMEGVRENFQLIHGLKHPNIASVDFLERDEYGAYFLIMEYAKGENLTQWIKRKWRSGRPELGEVAAIVKQIAAALDYAHSQKILHRDIKPANVMADENGVVKVLDFGLASKVRNTLTSLSVNPANTSGTPNYLSPEQFKGKYPTPASDRYALGVLTYQMLAGHLPFESDDLNMLHIIVARETPDPIDGVPDAVNSCLQKVLAKDPKARYASCAAFADVLAKGEDTPVAPQPISAPPPATNGVRRFRKRWWIIGAVLLLIAAAAVTIAVLVTGSSAAVALNTANMEIDLPGNVKLELVKIEAGSFWMGSPEGEEGHDSDETRHRVTLTKDFYLGKTEVTQAQWKAVMRGLRASQDNKDLSDPSYFKGFKGDDLPVVEVSWNDAMDFCRILNEKRLAPPGYKFTLPTEAQWEYAARGGNKSRGYKYSGSNDLDEVAWYTSNSGSVTHAVAMKKANELGLYDMSGNVWEWCLDWYEKGYAANPETLEGNSGSGRVFRGGSGFNRAWGCRSAYRRKDAPGLRDLYIGFRLALVRTPATTPLASGGASQIYVVRPGDTPEKIAHPPSRPALRPDGCEQIYRGRL